jgi:uncharacterized membrane protein YkvA (DUF1232 family)
VPVLSKALPLLAALYVISPLDLVPDIFPGLGQLDDVSVAVVTLEIFLRLCPVAAKAFHREAIAQSRRYSPMAPTDDVIDAEWRRE